MKKLALILLAAASLVGTAGAASAQWYGGGPYYGRPDPYYGDRYRAAYYDGRSYYRGGRAIIHQVAIGPGTVASEAGQFKTASASHIAATEIHF